MRKGKQEGPGLEDFLANVPAEKLRKFVITQAEYIPELYNALLLEFSAGTGGKNGSKYAKIIKKALASVSYDEYEDDYYYSEEGREIEALDLWIEKAWDYIDRKDYNEAILVSKALIEEYSQWLYDMDTDSSFLFSSEYQSAPFEIMEEAAEHAGKKELFDYCLSEIKKKKYYLNNTGENFHRLLENLAVTVDPDAFIALQDGLLAGVPDKSSPEAKIILERKVNFYRRLGQEEKAWSLIMENIHIESFCLEMVKNKIGNNDFQAAKILINEFIREQKKGPGRDAGDTWHGLLLDIARKEKDVPAIKELAFGFIEYGFRKDYFEIYKAAFSQEEWTAEREKLITHYSREKYFNESAADLLAVESDTGRLISYIEKHPSLSALEKYMAVLAYDYPEKTLNLLGKAISSYAKDHAGRAHYTYILSLLKKMARITGGRAAVSDLVADFRTRYKGRRAMMEILGKFR